MTFAKIFKAVILQHLALKLEADYYFYPKTSAKFNELSLNV